MSTESIGVLEDIAGLSYQCGDLTGTVSDSGRFRYRNGQTTVFSIGNVQLGSAVGKERMTFLDIVPGPPSVDDHRLVNRVRLLLSLTSGLGFENKISISDKAGFSPHCPPQCYCDGDRVLIVNTHKQAREAVSKHAAQVDLDSQDTSALDVALSKIGNDLAIIPKTASHARNQIRRAVAGFKVLRDIKIPVRDGNFVYADIYLPLGEVKKYPVLLASTIYGKRVTYSGPDLSDAHEIAEFERAEDEWFTTPAETDIRVPHTTPVVGRWSLQRRFETTSSFNTFLFVPRGYAMIKMDPRGVGQSPGRRDAKQETLDIFDAVEWAAVQPWSTGSVGLAGNSYGANCQWPVAEMKPKGLRCFIPFATDVDSYRDVAYQGGISIAGYLNQWLAGMRELSPKWEDDGSIWADMADHQFYDDFWKANSFDATNIDLPVLLAGTQVALVHARGAYEIWKQLRLKEKHLELVDGNYYSWPNHESASKVLAFADRYLKGNDAADLEPVGLQMRLGHKKWYWRTESDWEIPGTDYVKFYLNGDQSLTRAQRHVSGEKVFAYSAEKPTQGQQAGASFTSDPLEEDIELVGHFSARLYVSSSNHDADIVVHIWALDESNRIVSFCLRDAVQPLNTGWLRASHRKLDPSRTLPHRPYHTHKADDYSPLKENEAVEVDVELFPATARLKKGWKIRVDICPTDEQPAVPNFKPAPYRIYPDDIHKGATNQLHVGPDHVNYVMLPIVPLRDLRTERPLDSLEY